MKVLGIESTAHTAGIGLVEFPGPRILENRRLSVSFPFKPSEAAEHHARVFPKLLKSIGEFQVVAYSEGPGMKAVLKVGGILAAYFQHLGYPVFGVHHGVAHLEISRLLFSPKKPLYAYISGMHTCIVESGKIVGKSEDIGMGNLFDALAREFGFSSARPLYEWCKESKEFLLLPYTVKGMDFSFTGLLTRAKRLGKRPEVALSVFETAFAEFVEALERAVCLYQPKEIVCGGGVFQNPRLVEMVKSMAREHGVKVLIPPKELLGDNGAMIAASWTTGRAGKVRIRRNYPMEEGVRRWFQKLKAPTLPLS